MGFQNPNLGQKKHISMIAVIVFTADYFFWRPFWKYANKLIKYAKSRMVSGRFEIYGKKHNRNR